MKQGRQIFSNAEPRMTVGCTILVDRDTFKNRRNAMAEKSQYSVQAVAKTIDLLNALAGKQDATLAVLADKLSLNRNKTYRLLSTL